eukprot:4516880-Alexandrium_andersonii.AAC.2
MSEGKGSASPHPSSISASMSVPGCSAVPDFAGAFFSTPTEPPTAATAGARQGDDESSSHVLALSLIHI